MLKNFKLDEESANQIETVRIDRFNYIHINIYEKTSYTERKNDFAERSKI